MSIAQEDIMSKLAVFGATGGTGRNVVAHALAAGHEVAALVRDRARASAGLQRVVVGDVLDPEAVARTVEGVDAVVVALGMPARDRSGLRARGTQTVVRAMTAAGVRRLVVLSVLGAHESREGLDWFTRWLVFPLWLQQAILDHERQEEVVRDSGLDWTLVRPPHLTAGRATGAWSAGFDMTAAPPAMSVDRADVAQFMLWCATTDAYSGEAVGVTLPTRTTTSLVA
jgi:putative NADH-flavin reductase